MSPRVRPANRITSDSRFDTPQAQRGRRAWRDVGPGGPLAQRRARERLVRAEQFAQFRVPFVGLDPRQRRHLELLYERHVLIEVPVIPIE
jgi:hypothetical protein